LLNGGSSVALGRCWSVFLVIILNLLWFNKIVITVVWNFYLHLHKHISSHRNSMAGCAFAFKRMQANLIEDCSFAWCFSCSEITNNDFSPEMLHNVNVYQCK